MPRTTATGTPVALPMTSSAAGAISSATATSVTCSSRPSASVGAAEVDDGGDTGDADGDVGQSLAPRAAERVGDDHADVDAEVGAQPVADAPRRAVAVDGQQRGVARGHVRQVDARVGAHEAVRRLADDQVAAAAHDAHRFLLDQRLGRRRVFGIDGHQAALGLGDDLLRDDDDVAVEERAVGRGRDERRRVGRRRPLRRCRRARRSISRW